MENPSQLLTSLVQYISQLVSLNRRLQKKKIPLQTAKLAFIQLDSKRKGYLDLANVYELVGNNITEDQLFYLFKWLDISKTGDISPDDFQLAVVSIHNDGKQNNKEQNPLDCVKEIVMTFLENLQYKQNLKTKLQLNEDNLRKIFKSICQTQRKNNLQIQDLIDTMSFTKNWDSLCQDQVKGLFRQSKIISEKIFVEFLVDSKQSSPKKESKSQQIPLQHSGNFKRSYIPVQLNQSQLLDQINKQYCQSRNLNHIPATFRSSPKKQQQIHEVHRNNFTITPKNAYISQSVYSKKTQEKVNSQQNQQAPQSSEIQTMLNNIQKRRQQLRKGSMQRKKLIQQALQRKKTYFSNNSLFNNQPQCQKFVPQSPSYSSYSKTSNSFNPTSQFTVNNPVNFQFQKKFSKYRDQRVENENRFTPNKSYLQQNKMIKFSNIQQQKQTPYAYKQYEKKYSQNSKHESFDRISQFQQRSHNPVNLNIDLNNQKISTQADGFERTIPSTPKFSHTLQQNFYNYEKQSLSSNKKVDRIHEIRQKINNLPDMKSYQKNRELRNPDQAEVNLIIEKYRKNTNMSPQNLQFYNRNEFQNRRYHQNQNQQQTNLINNFLKSKDENLKSYPKTELLRNSLSKNCDTPKKSNQNDFYQTQKVRLNGSISSGYRPSSNNIQKENLLRKAEEEAARKIQEIQRKAKLKVLQRKSAIGLKWVK